MKISVYLKKCSATTSNICFRVREKNVDIKVVSPIAVHDRVQGSPLWDGSIILKYQGMTITLTF